MKKVVILQHRLLHYRITLFQLLREVCANRGIELHLVHGQASRRESVKKDEGYLPWAHKVNNRFLEVADRDIIWQPFPKNLKDADLVVVMQESRILSNYPLLLARIWSSRKVAYWGHGRNFQSEAPTGLRERWKNFLLGRVDWWFAYTQITVDILRKAGFYTESITCLNNAVDTSGFKADLASWSEVDIATEKERMGIAINAPIGLFCGSLYLDKRLDFLIESADRIFNNFPEFALVVIGDGPSMSQMREAAKSRPWLHLLGIRKGREKALYFRLADYMLNPGAVGLHIVDAFCAELVLLTTSNAKHGPEIAYLNNGKNGFMTEDSVDVYVQTVLQLMTEKIQLDNIKSAAFADSNKYTLENMVANFVEGIESCIKT